jgi:hypothetical protein
MRRRREWLVRLRCRSPVHSRQPACRRLAGRARACRASRSVRQARLQREFLDRCPCRRRERATEKAADRSGFPIRCVPRMHGGMRCAALRKRYGTLRHGRLETGFAVCPPRAHQSRHDCRRIRGELCSERTQRRRKVIGHNRGGAKSIHRVRRAASCTTGSATRFTSSREMRMDRWERRSLVLRSQRAANTRSLLPWTRIPASSFRSIA